MRTIIVDDNPLILEIEKNIISKNEYLNIVGEFYNGNKFLKSLSKLKPDVVFLDIEMPEINGIEIAEKVEEFNENIQIVFLTSYEKYAMEAFKVNTINYILKPLTKEMLDVTVKRLLKYRKKSIYFTENSYKNQIITLGNFEVYGNGGKEVVKWPTIKEEELFAYFIYLRGEKVDKWKLCEMLWSNLTSEKALHNLHNTIYRLKKTLKFYGIENQIMHQQGSYSGIFGNIHCDLWELEDLMNKKFILNEPKIKNIEVILSMYKGDLYGSKDYVWAIDLKENIEKYYLNTIKALSKYYYDKNLYYKTEEYTKKFLKLNPIDEDSIELLMKTFYKFNDKLNIITIYKNLEIILKKELDIEPRKSTKLLYLNLLEKL